MASFRDFQPGEEVLNFMCSEPICENSVDYYVVHQTVGGDDNDYFIVDYACEEHKQDVERRFRQRFKEDGVHERVFVGKIRGVKYDT